MEDYRRFRFAEGLWLFLFGGEGYYGLELLYRGHSHFSMALCGGLCFLTIYQVRKRCSHFPRLLRWVLEALLITLAELATGCIVNLWLGLGVWSYSSLPWNLWGQICLPYSVLWFLLAIPADGLSGFLQRFLFQEVITVNP